jgi:hypothetical protein
MNETKTTLTYLGVAVVLVLAVFLTAPGKVTPDDFLDQNEPFFPDFTDPNLATTLEVIDFDPETATARPFKVTFEDGKWIIPSHNNFPADGKDRLAETAAGVIDIRKDDYRTANVADHAALGVVDPLDESVSVLTGRGKRVTVKDENDQVLADLIIGDNVEGRENLRFVRLPEQKRVYVSRINIDISTRFEDWIERDLLQVELDKIERVQLKDYSINETTGRLNQRDDVILEKEGDTWSANRMASTQEVASDKMTELLGGLDGLSIVGVRPKPEGLSRSLSQPENLTISQADMLSLRSKGYYFAQTGQLVSNEGEIEVRDGDGIIYTLRFGEIVYGTGEAVSAGNESSDDDQSGPAENRYLFVTTSFDSARFPEPRRPDNTDFLDKEEDDLTDADRRNKELQDDYEEWETTVEVGSGRSGELNARFADWYYVISAESFDKIHLTRVELVRQKETE